jgi:hypothetical protein
MRPMPWPCVVTAVLAFASCECDVSGWGRDGVNPARISGDVAATQCLLVAPTVQVHVHFGYRGCFSGSDNDLDLGLSDVAVLSGRLHDRGVSGTWAIGPTTMDREVGREHLRLFVAALQKEDEGTSGDQTTGVFVRMTYWCDDEPTRAIALSTNRFSSRMKREHDERRRPHRAEPYSEHSYYSRVHGLVETLETILAYGSKMPASGFDTAKTPVSGACESNAGADSWSW